jgi:ribosome biogenesis GTPase / thiamine phosphate phosphatase
MYRQDEVRIKSFAANIDQTLILLAAEPEFSERQLARALIAAEAQDIQPLIVLNKSDLGTPFQMAWKRLQPYRDMGYEVIGISLAATATAVATPQPPSADGAQTLARLESLLVGKTTLVMGPSGAGKSTLINRWVPHARVTTNEISKALNSGKHTTTSTHWYWVGGDRGTALIDSPGFQEFGLHHIGPTQLASLMPDLRRHLGNCKYHNCTHLHEPGCGVILQMKNADNALYISDIRYKIYQNLFAELSAIRHW